MDRITKRTTTGGNSGVVSREETLLRTGAHTVASGVGIAALVGAFAGREGAIVGAVVGAAVALRVPRLRHGSAS